MNRSLRHLLHVFAAAAVTTAWLLAPCWILPARADDEFVGPFPSWRDAKRDYGAVAWMTPRSSATWRRSARPGSGNRATRQPVSRICRSTA